MTKGTRAPEPLKMKAIANSRFQRRENEENVMEKTDLSFCRIRSSGEAQLKLSIQNNVSGSAGDWLLQHLVRTGGRLVEEKEDECASWT